MKFILEISVIVYCIYAANAQASCQDKKAFVICRESDVITSVTRDPERYEKTLTLGDAQSIAPDAFKKLDIQELVIVRTEAYWKPRPSNVLSLGPDSFNDLKNLTTLKFLEVKLIYESSPLMVLKSLVELALTDAELTEIPTDLFSGSNITKLSIKGNSINVLHPNAFAGLKNLQFLSLPENDITTLEPGCFHGLSELRSLELNYNKLTLTSAIFSALEKLTYLDLHNAVKTFHPQAFRGLRKLVRLINSRNRMLLEAGMFDDSLALEDIHLRGSRISDIPKNVFNNLTSLQFLTFSFNVIRSIEPGAFAGTKVTNLNMEAAYRGSILHAGAFYNLTVGKLKFTWNQPMEFRPRAFHGIKAKTLVLAGNGITKIAAEMFTGAEIKTLDMRHNSVEKVERDAFKNATIGSLIVDSSDIILKNRLNWQIPDSMEIRSDFYA